MSKDKKNNFGDATAGVIPPTFRRKGTPPPKKMEPKPDKKKDK